MHRRVALQANVVGQRHGHIDTREYLEPGRGVVDREGVGIGINLVDASVAGVALEGLLALVDTDQVSHGAFNGH
ncbi:hypothetical protein D3C78_1786380 [compost metagenome]